jgi:L-asparaginase II
MEPNPIVAEVVRSGFTESWHRGVVVALAADGTTALTSGSAYRPIFARSSNKPLQAVAMRRLGLPLTGELLALAAASHYGEDFHAEGVRAILTGAGLTESDLRCPPSRPLHQATADAMVRTGRDRDRVRMNCSGKHAAMLATCVRNGWPTASYTDPDHPLQVRIRETTEELAGEPVTATAVDGCGAPLFAYSPAGLARAYRRLVLAPAGTAERDVVDAMRAYPEWTSGTGQDAPRLMRAIPGLVVKGGAEAVDAIALPDGRAAAIKIDDGGMRARTPVTVAVLRALGALRTPGTDGAELSALATRPINGGGDVVGEVRAVPPPLAVPAP